MSGQAEQLTRDPTGLPDSLSPEGTFGVRCAFEPTHGNRRGVRRYRDRVVHRGHPPSILEQFQNTGDGSVPRLLGGVGDARLDESPPSPLVPCVDATQQASPLHDETIEALDAIAVDLELPSGSTAGAVSATSSASSDDMGTRRRSDRTCDRATLMRIP